MRLENDKKELEKKNLYLARMFDETKLNYEAKVLKKLIKNNNIYNNFTYFIKFQ